MSPNRARPGSPDPAVRPTEGLPISVANPSPRFRSPVYRAFLGFSLRPAVDGGSMSGPCAFNEPGSPGFSMHGLSQFQPWVNPTSEKARERASMLRCSSDPPSTAGLRPESKPRERGYKSRHTRAAGAPTASWA